MNVIEFVIRPTAEGWEICKVGSTLVGLSPAVRHSMRSLLWETNCEPAANAA